MPPVHKTVSRSGYPTADASRSGHHRQGSPTGHAGYAGPFQSHRSPPTPAEPPGARAGPAAPEPGSGTGYCHTASAPPTAPVPSTGSVSHSPDPPDDSPSPAGELRQTGRDRIHECVQWGSHAHAVNPTAPTAHRSDGFRRTTRWNAYRNWAENRLLRRYPAYPPPPAP